MFLNVSLVAVPYDTSIRLYFETSSFLQFSGLFFTFLLIVVIVLFFCSSAGLPRPKSHHAPVAHSVFIDVATIGLLAIETMTFSNRWFAKLTSIIQSRRHFCFKLHLRAAPSVLSFYQRNQC